MTPHANGLSTLEPHDTGIEIAARIDAIVTRLAFQKPRRESLAPSHLVFTRTVADSSRYFRVAYTVRNWVLGRGIWRWIGWLLKSSYTNDGRQRRFSFHTRKNIEKFQRSLAAMGSTRSQNWFRGTRKEKREQKHLEPKLKNCFLQIAPNNCHKS